MYIYRLTHSSKLSGFTRSSSLTMKAECGIEIFEFIVSERVQVHPDNLRAMSPLTFLLFKLKLAKLLTTRKNTSTSLNEKFKIRNLSFQNRYSPGSCFLGVFSGAPRACSARSGAPWVRKTSVIT